MTSDNSHPSLFENEELPGPSTSSADGFHASRVPTRVKSKPKTMTDGYGMSFCDWCGSFDLCTCWQKTLQGYLLSRTRDLSGYSTFWKRRGTKSKHFVLVLGRSEAHSDATACSSSGYWYPTPCANDDNKTPEAHMAMKARMKGGPRNSITSLNVLSKTWPTPRTEGFDAGGHRVHERGLQQEAQHWATPKASPSGPDFARMGRTESGGDDLATMMARLASTRSTPTTQDSKNNGNPSQQTRDNLNSEAGGSLNPAWVEILQGLPGDWTDLSGLPAEEQISLSTSLRAWRKAERIAKKG